jgi:hypothetical protein
MQAQREIIQNLLSEKPQFKNRKFRYNAISEILEKYHNIILEQKDIQLICSLADEYRHQTEADEVGKSEEKKWHKKDYQFSFQNETEEAFKKLTIRPSETRQNQLFKNIILSE